MSKKRRKKPPAPEQKNVPVKIDSPKKHRLGFWPLIGGIAALVTIVLGYPEFKEKFLLTDHERFENEISVSGDIKTPVIRTNTLRQEQNETFEKSMHVTKTTDESEYPVIKGIYIKDFFHKKMFGVRAGRGIIVGKPTFLEKGVLDLMNNTTNTCVSNSLLIGVRDDSLYISAEFKDLKKEETIGYIQYNHWKLYKANMLDFKSSETGLEVRDKQNNVAFSIHWNEQENLLSFSGYFIDPLNVFIVSENLPDKYPAGMCISKHDSNWRTQAEVEISHIKSEY